MSIAQRNYVILWIDWEVVFCSIFHNNKIFVIWTAKIDISSKIFSRLDLFAYFESPEIWDQMNNTKTNVQTYMSIVRGREYQFPFGNRDVLIHEAIYIL